MFDECFGGGPVLVVKINNFVLSNSMWREKMNEIKSCEVNSWRE